MSESKAAGQRENRFQEVFLHTLVSKEFYEPLSNYIDKLEFLAIVKQYLPANWRTSRSGIWRVCMPPVHVDRIQGWKIHVSAIATNAACILARVVPVCMQYGVAFKFACDSWMLSLLNSKRWNRGGSGKFITIYPSSDDEFKVLLEELYVVLKGFEGPFILSDQRYKDCPTLYYRYGQIRGLAKLDSSGLSLPVIISPEGTEVEDIRTPFYSPPRWVTQEPFEPSEDDPGNDNMGLQNGRYTITGVLGYTNTGGVYRAHDNVLEMDVVIKEARPHTMTDARGLDATNLLAKEYRILKKIEDTGIAAKPIDLFWEWEHLFLVESFVNGVPLGSFAAQNSCVIEVDPGDEQLADWLEKIRLVAQRLAQSLKVLHDRRIVFGDLSPNNVLINADTMNVSLIDVEGAYEIGIDQHALIFTPGYAAKGRSNRTTIGFEDDFYAFGSLLLTLIHPINALLQLKPDALPSFLSEIKKDTGIPQELIDIILSLMDEDEGSRPRPESVITKLNSMHINPKDRLLSEPATPKKEELQTLLVSMSDYICRAATFERRDRLFPSDPGLLNPLHFSYGASGVIYALHRINGQVPIDMLKWFQSHAVSSERYAPGLYVGLSGIAWALSDLGLVDEAKNILTQAANHRLLYTAADINSGLAGYGLACIHLWSRLSCQGFLDNAVLAGDWLVQTATRDDNGVRWPDRNGVTHLGYLRGASGIAAFLLYLYLATGNRLYLDVGTEALLFDLSYGVEVPEGFLSYPATIEDTAIVLPYWEVGTAGIGTTLLRYMHAAPDAIFTKYFGDIVRDTFRKYTVFPGLFRGLAGIGNFLLDCHQFTGKAEFLTHSHRVLEGINLFKLDRPTGTAFPGDHLQRISTDFATGSSGVALFISRLMNGGNNFNLLPDDLLFSKGLDSHLEL